MFTILRNRIFLIVNICMIFAIVLVRGVVFHSRDHIVDSLLGLTLFDLVFIFRMKRKLNRQSIQEKY